MYKTSAHYMYLANCTSITRNTHNFKLLTNNVKFDFSL